MFTECFREVSRTGASSVWDDVAVQAVCWVRLKRDWGWLGQGVRFLHFVMCNKVRDQQSKQDEAEMWLKCGMHSTIAQHCSPPPSLLSFTFSLFFPLSCPTHRYQSFRNIPSRVLFLSPIIHSHLSPSTPSPSSSPESAHSSTADSCGYPTPVCLRVVHTDPGPIPIYRNEVNGRWSKGRSESGRNGRISLHSKS
jgi:hypothetical protein